MRYTVILRKEEDGGCVATVPVLPGCVSQGDTRDEALKNMKKPSRFTWRTSERPGKAFL